MTATSEILADAPWGFWEQTETSGTNLADSSGNARSLTITGSPTLDFAGPVSELPAISWPTSTANAASTATTATSNATEEAWVYLTALPTGLTPVIGCMANSSVFDKALFIAPSGQVGWYVYNGAGRRILSPQALSLNTWHRVAGTVGPAGQRLYVDRDPVALDAAVTTSYSGTAQTVGVRRAVGTMNGGFGTLSGQGAMLIAAPAFFTTQLTDDRLNAHYDAVNPLPAFTGTWGIEF